MDDVMDRVATIRRLRRAPLAAVVLCASAALAASVALAPGDAAPDLWAFRLEDGSRVRLQYDDDRFTLVNFWATWCEPCRDEMPALQALQDDHPDRLQVVGVLNDSVDGRTALEFLAEYGVTYLNVRPNPKRIAEWGGLGVLPTTFLIGPDGAVVRRYIGATDEQVAGLVADVAAALEGRPLPPLVVPDTSNAVSDSDRPRTPPPGG